MYNLHKCHVAFSKVNFSTIALQCTLTESCTNVLPCIEHQYHDKLLPYFHSNAFLLNLHAGLIKVNSEVFVTKLEN